MAAVNLESFKVAGRKVFDGWTALTLAVEHGWGGRDSRKKKEDFFVNVMEGIAASKWQPDNENHVATVAEGLEEFLEDNFNTTCEDGSTHVVAKLLLDLFVKAKAGDYSLAEAIMQQHVADINTCKGEDRTEFVDPSLIDESDDDGMTGQVGQQQPNAASSSGGQMFDEHGNFIGGGTTEEQKPKKEKVEPIIDDDGFETVQKGGRRR
eukprot:gene647-318_t